MNTMKPRVPRPSLSSSTDRLFFQKFQHLVSMARLALEEAQSYYADIKNPYWKGRALREFENL